MSQDTQSNLSILFSSCFGGHHSEKESAQSRARIEEKKYAAKIEDYLKGEKNVYEKRSKENSVIMLGSSDSGKSTLLKQMKILHGNGFSPQERAAEKRRIRTSCLVAVITLLDICGAAEKDRDDDPSDLVEKYKHLPQIYEQYANGNTQEIDSADAVSFRKAWYEPDMQILYEESNLVHESTSYFMEKIDVIFSPAYNPSDVDILNLRTTTRNVSDNAFTIYKNNILHVIDVSGLAHHRKTWIPYFDDVTSIIYIASLSSYDQTMAEDKSVNRMVDAMLLFQEMANHKALLKKPFILFLNKKDLFEKKIKTKHIVDHFPNFKGPKRDAAAGIKYFESKFRDANTAKRDIITHVTCATDTEVMKVILASVLIAFINTQIEAVSLVY